MLQHLAIIMDGNGRWAKSQGLKRTYGHYQGVEVIKKVAIHANKLGIKQLTLFAFSTENWKRSEEEVNYIMSLPEIFFNAYLKILMEEGIKVTVIGDLSKIPEKTKEVIDKAIAKTKDNSGLNLCIALNYGARAEIVRACNNFAQDYKEGKADLLDEETFKNYLYTGALSEVDLLVRTSGELRISNFLLYQIAYSELLFLPCAWPEFDEEMLETCIEEFEGRQRRFGVEA